MLGTHSKALTDGAQFGADVFAQDVGGARGGREQACQDGPRITNQNRATHITSNHTL